MAVLYTVYGSKYYNEDWESSGSLRNGYTWQLKVGYRGYAAPKDDSQVEEEIERLMTFAP